MGKTRNNCYRRQELSICNDTDLCSNMEFMSIERVREECQCEAKGTCIVICEKLKQGDKTSAFVMMSDLITN